MDNQMIFKPAGFAITALIAGFFIVLSFIFQEPISYNSGLGWDGAEYFKAAQNIAENQTPEAKAPFVYRIGTPFLVAKLFPEDLKAGFFYINLAFSVINIFLVQLFLGLFIKNRALLISGVILYAGYWQAPLRLTFFYPVHADPAALTFLFAGLFLVFYHKKTGKIRGILYYLTALAFAGGFFREICLVPAFIYFADTFYKRNIIPATYTRAYLSPLPLFAGIAAVLIAKSLVLQTNSYSFITAAAGNLYGKPLFKFIHASFLAWGPILILPAFFRKSTKEFFRQNPMMLLLIGIFLLFGISGGFDTERILFWGAPAVFALAAFTFEENKKIAGDKFFLAILIATQVISSRIFFLTPDYSEKFSKSIIFLTEIPGTNFFNLFTSYGNEKTLLISFAAYLGVFILLYIFLALKKRKFFISG
jgi:hypothetical protein